MFKRKQTAKPSTECVFPKCEQCEHYVEVDERNFCNVPMVISKQEKLLTDSIIARMNRRIDDIECIVYKEL